MADFLDYKELVVEIMETARARKHLDTQGTMLELRLSLFSAACQSGNPELCVQPFPPCFFNHTTKTKDFDGLRKQIELIPALDKLTSARELPTLAWKLLYWIFTSPLTISPLFTSNMVLTPAVQLQMQLHTGGLTIPDADSLRSSCFIFEVRNPALNPRFVAEKDKYGSFFAFHGSPLHNFHSIIHRGLKSALNRRSAFGPGTYFSSSFSDSRVYAYTGSGWTNSLLGKKLQCMAICEIVNSPSGLRKYPPQFFNGTVTVVTDDDLIQLTFLLLFAPGFLKRVKASKA